MCPPSSAFPRLALRPESRRSRWPGVGGPRAGHLASPFSACVGARGGRDRRVGPAFPYLPLEPRPPFLCPSSAGGRGLTREGELMGGGSWRPDLRGTGRSWRPFSFRGGREDRTWAWSRRRGPDPGSCGTVVVVGSPHPWGPRLGLSGLSEATWSEAIVSLFTGRRRRRRWRAGRASASL